MTHAHIIHDGIQIKSKSHIRQDVNVDKEEQHPHMLSMIKRNVFGFLATFQ